MKNAFIRLLTTVFLPAAAILSFMLIALLVAALIVFSPLILLGGTIKLGTYLSEKITDWLFSMKIVNSPETSRKEGNAYLFTSLSLTLMFIALTALPVAFAIVILIAITAPLSVPVLAVMGAFTIAEEIANKIVPEPIDVHPFRHINPLLSTEDEKLISFSSEQDKVVSINKELPKTAFKTTKMVEPPSHSRGLNFFMPLLERFSSLVNCADSTEEEDHNQTSPSPYRSSNERTSK